MQLAMSEVLALCASHNVALRAIERAPEGAIHLVCRSGSGADLVRRKAKSKVMTRQQAGEKQRPLSQLA